MPSSATFSPSINNANSRRILPPSSAISPVLASSVPEVSNLTIVLNTWSFAHSHLAPRNGVPDRAGGRADR